MKSVTVALMFLSVAYGGYQEFDIFSGEHLDDVIMATDGSVTAMNAVLIVYEQNCVHKISEHRLYSYRLPLTKYVCLLKHDYVTSQTHTWYGYNGDDIKQRYDVSTCWAALFIAKGSAKDTPPKRWYPDIGRDFSDWVWDQLRVPVQITNHNHFRLKVTIGPGYGGANGPETYEPIGVDPGATTIQMFPLSLVMSVHTWDRMSDDRHYVGVYVLKNSLTQLEFLHNPKDDYLWTGDRDRLMSLEDDEDHKKRDWIWSHTTRHLLNLKQPLVTPQLTDIGYLKRDIPKQWYDILRGFYKDNKVLRTEENWPHIDAVVNFDEIHPTMVHLSDHVKEVVARGLQDLHEEWCQCKLELTAFYGVREYYRGNILRNHVDRVETHVISAILQIEQDLGDDGEDWLLEVIDFHGDRHEIQLKPGEMLLYESARLIHGRPKPFTGKRFANVFLHFKPKRHLWTDTHYRTGMTLHYPQDQQERLLPLNTNLTQTHARKRKLFVPTFENESKRDTPSKTEL